MDPAGPVSPHGMTGDGPQADRGGRMDAMRSDALANRRDLVSAASGLLAEQGAGMSLRAVAQAAGVGVGTLYRHFPSRVDLLTAVLEDVVERLTAHLERFIEGDEPAAERWLRLSRALADEDLANLLAARDSLGPDEGPPPERMAEAERVIMALTDRAVDLARRGGLVADGVGGHDWFTGLLIVTRPPLPALEAYVSEQRDWLLRVYLRGLRPD